MRWLPLAIMAAGCAHAPPALVRTGRRFGSLAAHRSAALVIENRTDGGVASRTEVLWRKGEALELNAGGGQMRILVTPAATRLYLLGRCIEAGASDLHLHDVMLAGLPASAVARREALDELRLPGEPRQTLELKLERTTPDGDQYGFATPTERGHVWIDRTTGVFRRVESDVQSPSGAQMHVRTTVDRVDGDVRIDAPPGCAP
jgi:hypothetical protein